MKVEPNRVVQFHYDVKGQDGQTLESSRSRDPALALQGRGNVMRGVDEALLGRAAGDRFEVTVPPEKGFGNPRPGQHRRLSKKYFANPKRLKVGDVVVVRTEQGAHHVTVLKVGRSVIDVDLNHPMAGQTLQLEIEILDVREADAEELLHGHPNGPGGHQH